MTANWISFIILGMLLIVMFLVTASITLVMLVRLFFHLILSLFSSPLRNSSIDKLCCEIRLSCGTS